MNAPLATDFTDKISGWGMNFEGVYDVTSHFRLVRSSRFIPIIAT